MEFQDCSHARARRKSILTERKRKKLNHNISNNGQGSSSVLSDGFIGARRPLTELGVGIQSTNGTVHTETNGSVVESLAVGKENIYPNHLEGNNRLQINDSIGSRSKKKISSRIVLWFSKNHISFIRVIVQDKKGDSDLWILQACFITNRNLEYLKIVSSRQVNSKQATIDRAATLAQKKRSGQQSPNQDVVQRSNGEIHTNTPVILHNLFDTVASDRPINHFPSETQQSEVTTDVIPEFHMIEHSGVSTHDNTSIIDIGGNELIFS
ncbi:hypothetical protein PIB30_029197 [Stylosanthes scabra]|uniref:Uncharacterized protein n=1 Tax=Stylosanthes scabra TaxID=79078 RepID=A0ABU6QBP9_9FABA|nr:hypothetical protein [Stylosanthes scabra]